MDGSYAVSCWQINVANILKHAIVSI